VTSPEPVTGGEVRAYLTGVDAGAARVRNGVTLATVAAALGCRKDQVWRWENRRSAPRGTRGAAYCRVVAGLLRHLEVPRDGRVMIISEINGGPQ
jgi:hypothetical protein